MLTLNINITPTTDDTTTTTSSTATPSTATPSAATPSTVTPSTVGTTTENITTTSSTATQGDMLLNVNIQCTVFASKPPIQPRVDAHFSTYTYTCIYMNNPNCLRRICCS